MKHSLCVHSAPEKGRLGQRECPKGAREGESLGTELGHQGTIEPGGFLALFQTCVGCVLSSELFALGATEAALSGMRGWRNLFTFFARRMQPDAQIATAVRFSSATDARCYRRKCAARNVSRHPGSSLFNGEKA